MKTLSPAVKDPGTLIELIIGYRKAKVLMVATYHRVFDSLDRPVAAGAVALRCALDPRATEILLDALVAMGLVEKSGGLYSNTEISSRFLVDGSPQSLGDNLRFQELIWDAWGDLRRIIKDGSVPRTLDYWLLKHEGFAREYIRGMDNIAKGPSREIAGIMEVDGAKSLLDVGAGPGAYSLAFLERHPGLRATLLDLPVTLKVTRELLERRPGLASRVRLKAGDYHRSSFGHREHDLVLMSHITHDESPEQNQALFRKAHRALKTGGRLIVHDFTVRDDRTAPLFGALFSVHMLAFTRGGRTYTASEYRQWLKDAGFAGLHERKIGISSRNSSRIVVGIKRP